MTTRKVIFTLSFHNSPFLIPLSDNLKMDSQDRRGPPTQRARSSRTKRTVSPASRSCCTVSAGSVENAVSIGIQFYVF